MPDTNSEVTESAHSKVFLRTDFQDADHFHIE